MLLNATQIHQLITSDVIEGGSHELVNSASLDLRLGRYLMVETLPEETRRTGMSRVISLAQKDALTMTRIDLYDSPTKSFILRPGQFILAETTEKFNLPLWLSSEYKLKSSMARIGLEHLNAGWCDAGWTGSVLTLEFRNLTTFHEIELVCGDKIGQMVFFKHNEVEYDDSYTARGRYNNLETVSAPIPDRPVAGN